MSAYRGMVQTLLASGAQTTSGNSGVLNLGQLGGGGPDGATFQFKVTASSTPTTLDVYLQTSIDQGSTWIDFVHFAQAGAVSTFNHVVQWCRRAHELNTANTGDTATGDAVLAAGIVLNTPIVDNYFRVKWVIVGTSYTFAVNAILDRD